MTDKLITHEEARQKTIYIYGEYDNAYKTLNDYITQQEQRDKDVARYFELSHNPTSNTNPNEIRPYIEWATELMTLEEKLTKGVAK